MLELRPIRQGVSRATPKKILEGGGSRCEDLRTEIIVATVLESRLT